MYIVDDPTLALIIRFMREAQSLNLSDADFLLEQLEAIEEYVSRYPDEERQARAMEWIEAHAQQYRQRWQKRAAMQALNSLRCSDCPLTGGKPTSPCSVHQQWLELLSRYAAGEISGSKYVEEALRLLNTHKERLKVSKARRPVIEEHPVLVLA